jgi:hypothetical protein
MSTWVWLFLDMSLAYSALGRKQRIGFNQGIGGWNVASVTNMLLSDSRDPRDLVDGDAV